MDFSFDGCASFLMALDAALHGFRNVQQHIRVCLQYFAHQRTPFARCESGWIQFVQCGNVMSFRFQKFFNFLLRSPGTLEEFLQPFLGFASFLKSRNENFGDNLLHPCEAFLGELENIRFLRFHSLRHLFRIQRSCWIFCKPKKTALSQGRSVICETHDEVLQQVTHSLQMRIIVSRNLSFTPERSCKNCPSVERMVCGFWSPVWMMISPPHRLRRAMCSSM